MTFYLKYRPQTVADLDLVEVRDSLSNILKAKIIPHAFLFSGPKGTGKTSAARIVAKVINCERRRKNSIKPCNKCSQCVSIASGTNIDVVELDAASNRGIGDIRTLREAVKLAPVVASKKIYIIDEAHMLTTEASNALLKTLEEPPNHVVFVLATTNPEKLLDTIRSRVVNLVFKKASKDELVKSLQKKIKGEKIKVSDESLSLISEVSDGSFRDADKILEQMVYEKVNFKPESVKKFLKRFGGFDTSVFINFLAKKDCKSALLWIEDQVSLGVSSLAFCESMLSDFRHSLLSKYGIGDDGIEFFDKKELLVLIELFSLAYSDIKISAIEHLPLEVATARWCGDSLRKDNGLRNGKETPADEELINSENSAVSARDNLDQSNAITSKAKVKKFGKFASGKNSKISDEVWVNILSQIKLKNTSTEALLRASRPLNYDGKTLTLGVYYNFHKEHLEANTHKMILEDVITDMLGTNVRVVCELCEPPMKTQQKNNEKINNNNQTNDKNDFSQKVTQEGFLTENKDEDIMKIAEDIFSN